MGVCTCTNWAVSCWPLGQRSWFLGWLGYGWTRLSQGGRKLYARAQTGQGLLVGQARQDGASDTRWSQFTRNLGVSWTGTVFEDCWKHEVLKITKSSQ